MLFIKIMQNQIFKNIHFMETSIILIIVEGDSFSITLMIFVIGRQHMVCAFSEEDEASQNYHRQG